MTFRRGRHFSDSLLSDIVNDKLRASDERVEVLNKKINSMDHDDPNRDAVVKQLNNEQGRNVALEQVSSAMEDVYPTNPYRG